MIHIVDGWQSDCTTPDGYVVVVDALDECDDEANIRTVLQLWSQPSIPVAVLRRPLDREFLNGLWMWSRHAIRREALVMRPPHSMVLPALSAIGTFIVYLRLTRTLCHLICSVLSLGDLATP